MRKIIVLNRVTLDGFFAGPNGEIDFFIPDPEVDRAAHELMQVDTLLMGRVTYQQFADFWPSVGADPNAPEGFRRTAAELEQMKKIVFSNTLEEVTWKNSGLVKGDIIQAVKELKQALGPDITIFGSGSIVRQLASAGLIEEYLLALTPVVLGAGKPMFEGVKSFNLKLLEKRDYPSGNVLLHYQNVSKMD